MKVLFGMALRQSTGFVESLLRLAGLDWTMPDSSPLSRRQKTLAFNIPYRGSERPLHLLIPSHGLQANLCRAADSTGIKVEGEGEGEWPAHKHGGPKRRVWRQVHNGSADLQRFFVDAPLGDCAQSPSGQRRWAFRQTRR